MTRSALRASIGAVEVEGRRRSAGATGRLRATSALVGLAVTAHAQVSLDWHTTFGQPAQPDVVVGCGAASNGDVLVSYASPLPQTSSLDTLRLARISADGNTLVDQLVVQSVQVNIASHLVDASGASYLVGAVGDFAYFPARVLKLDAAGALLWQDSFGAANSWNEARGALTSDGGVVVVSAFNFNQRTDVRRYSPSGQLLWSQEMEVSPFAEQWNDVLVLPDDSVVAVGRTFASRATIALFTPTGQLAWVKDFSTLANQDERFLGVALGGDGRIVACGDRGSGSSPNSTALIGVYAPSNGAKLSSYAYDGPGNSIDGFVDAATASDGAVWCVGSSGGSGTRSDVLALRWPSGAGSAQAQIVRWDGGGFADEGRAVTAGSAGQVWIAGSTSSSSATSSRDGLVLQLDATAQVDWAWRSNAAGVEDRFEHLALSPYEGLVAAGSRFAGAQPDAAVSELDLHDLPLGYCTAKVNSLGCTPELVFAGMPSAGATSGFTLSVSQMRNQRSGVFLYGLGSGATPFAGGFACVGTLLGRTPLSDTGGSPASGADCSGILSLDFNAFAAGALGGSPAPHLSAVGAHVACQAWARDPGSTSGLSLSSGLRYTVLP